MAELLDGPGISWLRVGQLSNELGGDAFGISASLVSIIIIDMPENISRMRYPDPLRECRDMSRYLKLCSRQTASGSRWRHTSVRQTRCPSSVSF